MAFTLTRLIWVCTISDQSHVLNCEFNSFLCQFYNTSKGLWVENGTWLQKSKLASSDWCDICDGLSWMAANQGSPQFCKLKLLRNFHPCTWQFHMQWWYAKTLATGQYTKSSQYISSLNKECSCCTMFYSTLDDYHCDSRSVELDALSNKLY